MVTIPAGKKFPMRGRKDFECVVRQPTLTVCHPVGTVKMGKDTDSSAVLDSKLRVRGTQGLRVVDSSVMPTIPDGHPYTPSLMIGEMGAKFILKGKKRQE